MVDEDAAARIARLCTSGAPAGTRFLEIGAGTGTLTRALLAESIRLTALEIDQELIAGLRARGVPEELQLVAGDALDFDYAGWSQGRPWRVAGNLPYNVATPLILKLSAMPGGPQALTVMVQKEVADRLAARAGTSAYGSLSVAVQYAMHVDLAFTLSPNAFRPRPKVYSSVVQLLRRDRPAVSPRDPTLFWKVVRSAFAYRRKTLANSLSLALGYDRATIGRALERSNLSSEQRGERLTLDDFARLADALAEG